MSVTCVDKQRGEREKEKKKAGESEGERKGGRKKGNEGGREGGRKREREGAITWCQISSQWNVILLLSVNTHSMCRWKIRGLT